MFQELHKGRHTFSHKVNIEKKKKGKEELPIVVAVEAVAVAKCLQLKISALWYI